MAKLVSKVYGDALFEAARNEGNMDAMYEEALTLRSIFEEHQNLMQLLNHPRISKEEKTQVMKTVFGSSFSEMMMGFLTIIVEKGRQNDIPAILEYVISMVKEYKKIGTAYITSATELSRQQQVQIKERLLATTRYVEFEMNYMVDPSLIGGMVIRIGDRVVDSSIKTQLYELKKELLRIQMV